MLVLFAATLAAELGLSIASVVVEGMLYEQVFIAELLVAFLTAELILDVVARADFHVFLLLQSQSQGCI